MENPVESATFDKENGYMVTPDHRIWMAVSRKAQLKDDSLWVAVNEPEFDQEIWVELNSEIRITSGKVWVPLITSDFNFRTSAEMAGKAARACEYEWKVPGNSEADTL